MSNKTEASKIHNIHIPVIFTDNIYMYITAYIEGVRVNLYADWSVIFTHTSYYVCNTL